MKKIMATVFIFSLLLSPAIVQAPGPTSHMYMNDAVLSSAELDNSNIARIIKQNREYFDGGFMITDVTILFYFTHAKKYQATHDWSFQQAVMEQASTDKEKAFAYGIAAHLIQDSVYHNEYIPRHIKESYVINAIIHPMTEGIIDTKFINSNPEAFNRLTTSLDVVVKDKVLLKKVENLISSQQGVYLDLTSGRSCGITFENCDLTLLFQQIVASPDAFYSRYFPIKGVYESVAKGNQVGGIVALIIGSALLVVAWKLVKNKFIKAIPIFFGALFAFAGVFMLLGGISNLTGMQGSEPYTDKAIEQTIYYFKDQNWPNRIYEVSQPTGFDNLARADAEVIIFDIILATLAVVAVVVFIIFKVRR